MYIDKLHDITNEYNNTYHRTVKMKPIGVKFKFQVGYHVRVSKYKNIFAEEYSPY